MLLHQEFELDVHLFDSRGVCGRILQGTRRFNVSIEEQLICQLEQLDKVHLFSLVGNGSVPDGNVVVFAVLQILKLLGNLVSHFAQACQQVTSQSAILICPARLYVAPLASLLDRQIHALPVVSWLVRVCRDSFVNSGAALVTFDCDGRVGQSLSQFVGQVDRDGPAANLRSILRQVRPRAHTEGVCISNVQHLRSDVASADVAIVTDYLLRCVELLNLVA